MSQPNSVLSNATQPKQHQHPKFTCPHCQSPLIAHAKTWHCDGSLNSKNTQHSFDVARQGYVNLLPVQNKNSKDPGDSQESINARRRFLNQGFYRPLQQLVTTLIGKIEQDNNPKHWLDIGCGEGYYTQLFEQSLPNIDALIGVDISKPAIALFAKTVKQNQQLWSQIAMNPDKNAIAIYPIVASAAKLPLANSSISGISTIFSPILPNEFARVMQEKGRLIIAKPDVGHLQTLREALFDEVRPHDSDKFLEALAPFFTLKDTHYVQADLALDSQALTDLLTMTPYSYRAKLDKRDVLLKSSETQVFETEAKFVVYELVKV